MKQNFKPRNEQVNRPNSNSYEPHAYANAAQLLDGLNIYPHFAFELAGTDVLTLHKKTPRLNPVFNETTTVSDTAERQRLIEAENAVLSLYGHEKGRIVIASSSYDTKDLLAIFATVAYVAINKRHDVFVKAGTVDRKHKAIIPYPHKAFVNNQKELRVKAEGFFGSIAYAAGINITADTLEATHEGRMNASSPIYKKRIPVEIATKPAAGLH